MWYIFDVPRSKKRWEQTEMLRYIDTWLLFLEVNYFVIICWPGECASDISEPSERGAHPVLLSPRGFWRGKIRICFKLIFKVIAIILIGWKSEWMKNNISCTILLQKVREARQPFRDVAPGEEVQKPFTHINTCFDETFGDDTREFNLWCCLRPFLQHNSKICRNGWIGFRGKL